MGMLGMCLTGSVAAAPGTDVVVLANGDRITGEIKGLERGLLTLKTDALGTVEIEWAKIGRIETQQLLEIEDSAHKRYLGQVVGTGEDGSLQIAPSRGGVDSQLAMARVVRISPLSDDPWEYRLDGNVSLGLSAASANEDRQVALSAEVDYRDQRRSVEASYSGARTQSANNPDVQRQDAQFTYRSFSRESGFWAAAVRVSTNDQLDLRLRRQAGGGVGHYWLRDAKRELSGLVGLVVTRERYRGDHSREQLEGMLQGRFDVYRQGYPEIDVSALMTLYPSLSVSGRVRSEWSLEARVELIDGIYYELAYRRSQDNKPPGGDSRQIDWSLTTSVGYEF